MDGQLFTILEQADRRTHKKTDSAMTVSVIGAGGKTSLLYAAARGWKSIGDMRRCILTTTTQMYHPDRDRSLRGFPFDRCQTLTSAKDDLALPCTSAGETAYLFGRMHENGEKVYGIQPDDISQLAAGNDTAYVLVESDGANKRPLKAPADYEPVHPPRADVVIGVVGLSVLGKPFTSQWVHRIERMKTLLEHPDRERVSADMIAELAVHPAGLFKDSPSSARRVLLLNQADLCSPDEAAGLGSRFAPERLGIDGLVVSSMRPEFTIQYSTWLPEQGV